MSCIEYLSEILSYGSDKEKRELYKDSRGAVEKIEKRLAEIAVRQTAVKRKTM
jgi:nitrogen regulatory protein PII